MWSIPVLVAHGMGVAGQLPIPLWWVLYAAIALVVFTFLAVGRRWTRARFTDRDLGVELPGAAERVLAVARVAGRVAGAGMLGVVIASAVRGGEFAANALFVGVWVLVLLIAAVLGDVYALVNPFAGLAALLARLDLGSSPAWLDRVGRYPAAVVLLVFGWVELAHPDPGDPDVVLGFVLAYTLVMVVGGLWWGPRWVARADGFGVLFGLVGRMGVLGRGTDGRLRLRPPLVGLAGVRPVRGTAAVALVALGVTAFDGLSRSTVWEGVLGLRSGWTATPLQTVGLLVLVGIVATAYTAATSSAATLVGRPGPELVETFAPALVPIVVGYALAHYFSLVVFDGQLLLALASDPLGLGWDLFGTAADPVDLTAVTGTTIAWVQVAAILVGHVAAVVLAQERAVARFEAEVVAPSQHAFLGAVVLYAVVGLVLLLGA
ncbi:MAG: hypothetical protein KY461_15195 [Actinobacteria bacterium]|nr:hypothetical protein [Actinomycetota bacterium]